MAAFEDFIPLTDPRAMTGDEPLLDGTVRGFWSWTLSDLRTNTVRPMLAEYIVHRAVGGTTPTRIEWASHDVQTPTGIRIEVKSSAYLQAWRQRSLSQIRFAGLSGRTWDPETGYAEAPTFNADVYVFAVETETDPVRYDPLDAAQWRFWVAPARTIVERNVNSIGLSGVQQICDGPTDYDGLKAAVERAHRRNDPA